MPPVGAPSSFGEGGVSGRNDGAMAGLPQAAAGFGHNSRMDRSIQSRARVSRLSDRICEISPFEAEPLNQREVVRAPAKACGPEIGYRYVDCGVALWTSDAHGRSLPDWVWQPQGSDGGAGESFAAPSVSVCARTVLIHEPGGVSDAGRSRCACDWRVRGERAWHRCDARLGVQV